MMVRVCVTQLFWVGGDVVGEKQVAKETVAPRKTRMKTTAVLIPTIKKKPNTRSIELLFLRDILLIHSNYQQIFKANLC